MSAERGRGAGVPRYAALVGAAPSSGALGSVAVVGASADAPSILSHERCGVAPTRTRRPVDRKYGARLGIVLMQRALGDGAP